MRISEQRYARDRKRLDVAARLIDFEARTSTIRELTGLTDDRIRKLSKACGTYGWSAPATRHRGASPRRVSILLGKTRSRNEAAALLGLCQLMGVRAGPNHTSPGPGVSVSRTEKLCDVFWTFRYLLPQSSISFEHMLLLLSEAAKGEEMKTTSCASCRALLVVDALSRYSRVCSTCEESPADHCSVVDAIPYRCVAEESPSYR